MKPDSPFSNTRFEHEGSHLYFLPQQLIRILEAERPTFVIGTRGTGKTTLLQALNWKERHRNPLLRQQLPHNPFIRRYVGVYLKLPSIQLEALAALTHQLSESARGPLVALYIDLAWLELLCEALTELCADSVIMVTPNLEHKTVERLLLRTPSVRAHLFTRSPFTLASLGDAFGAMRKMIEDSARGRFPLDDLVARLPLEQAGNLGRAVGRTLGEMCNESIRPGLRRWHFKVCLDEAESLDDFQQLTLNTVIRLAEWPVFPIVSSVRLPNNATATLNQSLWLQKADRELILLDEMSDRDFRRLVEGIASVRVQAILGAPRIRFDVQRVLGPLDINGLLYGILKDSSSEGAQTLLRKARGLAGSQSAGRAPARDNQSLPIYQAYLVESLHLPWKPPQIERWKLRRIDSAAFRKKMVAAFLSICAEFRSRVPYSSADMVLQMSDNCVRDFLAQMEYVFVECGTALRRFLQNRAPQHHQVNALWKASEKKRDILQSQVAKSPAESERIVTGLATLTAFIQSSSDGVRHLVSNEPGRFQLKLVTPEWPADTIAQAAELVKEAAEAGYLKMHRASESELEFRVHTSLAAAYGFSYRGAYYPTALSIADIESLRRVSRDGSAFERAMKELRSRIAGISRESSATLFGVER